jgi:hypothetical protein
MAKAKFPEKQGNEVGYKKPPKATQFKKGQSGNPGGQKKGLVYLSEAYKRLMAMPAAEFDNYEPCNATERMAYAHIQQAIIEGDKRTQAIKEIADRTEGKPLQRKEVTNIDFSKLSDEQLAAIARGEGITDFRGAEEGPELIN